MCCPLVLDPNHMAATNAVALFHLPSRRSRRSYSVLVSQNYRLFLGNHTLQDLNLELAGLKMDFERVMCHFGVCAAPRKARF